MTKDKIKTCLLYGFPYKCLIRTFILDATCHCPHSVDQVWFLLVLYSIIDKSLVLCVSFSK